MGTPTFRIRTSPGNETWGWKIDREVNPADLERMQQLVAIRDHMKHNGLTDPATVDGPRYVRFFIGSNTKDAYQNPIDGSFQSQTDVDDAVSFQPVVANNMLYLLTDRGRLIAYR